MYRIIFEETMIDEERGRQSDEEAHHKATKDFSITRAEEPHAPGPTRSPPALDTTASRTGLCTIALFEAAKGLVVLLVGLGLLSLLHRDVGEFAARLVRRLHLNPARRYPHIFLEAAARMTDAKLWGLALGAAAYATMRFVEAYGLWRRRVWAEWFAILSGGLYLPWELYGVWRHATLLRAGIFLLNLVIVLYLLWVRLAARQQPKQRPTAGDTLL
jgi:uncharacterized membrane protein (DUF2068 family)